MHPSESTGGTDTLQVQDPKLRHAVHQESITEDGEEGKRDRCFWELLGNRGCSRSDLYSASSLKGPGSQPSFL